jgi:prepilin-type processing-associated H-X9-DG protein
MQHGSMALSEEQGTLFAVPSLEPGTVAVNERVTLRTAAGHRVLSVDGLVFHHYRLGDRMAEAYAAVSLVEMGYADQNDVARAFGFTTRTLRRNQERYGSGGLVALGRPRGHPEEGGVRRKADVVRDETILRLKSEGKSNRVIGRALGLDEKAVRKRLRRLGWRLPGTQAHLFAAPQVAVISEESTVVADDEAIDAAETSSEGTEPQERGTEPLNSASFDIDPLNRCLDRLLAAMGVIDDADPLFASSSCVPHAGVLLAIPFLVRTGVLTVASEVYGSLGPAFYGLRTTMIVLVLMALLRIKRPEWLKEQSPTELGRIVGLDRAPEMKTLRRKVTRLACFKRAAEFGRELAKRRIAQHGEALGFLYLDGHVRVYHGKRRLPKAHVTQMRISLPATTDYWVNDANGDPVFVVTAEANAAMTKMLPIVIEEMRRVLGPDRHLTIVFDRGGWSPKLFAQLLLDHIDILTYRKGRFRQVAKKRFVLRKAQIDGRQVHYLLDDRAVRFLRGKLRLRQVTRLAKDGHQTPILTSRWDLKDIVVAYRMFERWRQENFFKYLVEEYALDALVDYQVEPDDPKRSVPNPAWNALDKQVRSARAAVAKLKEQYGAAAMDNDEGRRPTMRGFKIAHAKLGNELRLARERLSALEKQRTALDRRVPVAEALKGQEVIKLSTERKHLTNVLKMVAYQIESEFLNLLSPHYKRAEDEGRTLLQTALKASAAIQPLKDELHVTLEALSSPHRSRAISALCEALNETKTKFPGTRLTLRFAVADQPR